jgi:hypothetical protein
LRKVGRRLCGQLDHQVVLLNKQTEQEFEREVGPLTRLRDRHQQSVSVLTHRCVLVEPLMLQEDHKQHQQQEGLVLGLKPVESLLEEGGLRDQEELDYLGPNQRLWEKL